MKSDELPHRNSAFKLIQRLVFIAVDGLHFVRAGKKARGACVKPWSLPVEFSYIGELVPRPELNRDPLFGKQCPVNAVHFFSAN